MDRNYEIDPALWRDLGRLCNVNSENRKLLMKAFNTKGEVSFYTNTDPFTGCPDEMSEIRTLKSEEEINQYLKLDFQDRLTRYLKMNLSEEEKVNYMANKGLISKVIDFIKQNASLPNNEEMKKLKEAC